MRIFKQKPVRKMVAFFLCIVLLLGNTVTYAQGNGQAVEDQQYSQTAGEDEKSAGQDSQPQTTGEEESAAGTVQQQSQETGEAETTPTVTASPTPTAEADVGHRDWIGEKAVQYALAGMENTKENLWSTLKLDFVFEGLAEDQKVKSGDTLSFQVPEEWLYVADQGEPVAVYAGDLKGYGDSGASLTGVQLAQYTVKDQKVELTFLDGVEQVDLSSVFGRVEFQARYERAALTQETQEVQWRIASYADQKSQDITLTLPAREAVNWSDYSEYFSSEILDEDAQEVQLRFGFSKSNPDLPAMEGDTAVFSLKDTDYAVEASEEPVSVYRTDSQGKTDTEPVEIATYVSDGDEIHVTFAKGIENSTEGSYGYIPLKDRVEELDTQKTDEEQNSQKNESKAKGRTANKQSAETRATKKIVFADGVTATYDDTKNASERLSKDVYWVDNKVTEGRYSAEEFKAQYYANATLTVVAKSEDGETEYIVEVPAKDFLSQDKITVTDLGGTGHYVMEIAEDSLPTVGDISGMDVSFEWSLNALPAKDGYYYVEVTDENKSQFTDNVNIGLGWYYLKTQDYTMTLQQRQGNLTNLWGLQNIFTTNMSFYFKNNGVSGSYESITLKELTDIEDDTGVKVVWGQGADGKSYTITVSNMPLYRVDGSQNVYYIKKNAESGDEDEFRLDGITNLTDGDYLKITYENDKVSNFGNKTDAAHSGGTVIVTVTGDTEYDGTKVWADEDLEDKSNRPELEFQLWRYTDKGDAGYKDAAPVKQNNGQGEQVTIHVPAGYDAEDTLDIDFVNGIAGGTDSDVLLGADEKLPKYDSEGYPYVYLARETMGSGTGKVSYEKLYGKVTEKSGKLTVTDSIPYDGERKSDDSSIYNGGTITNRIADKITTEFEKTWKAASFQESLGDVEAEFKLQYRVKDKAGEWQDAKEDGENITVRLDGFMAEILTQTHQQSMPEYDEKGRSLEYQWVETGVYQGENSKTNLLKKDGTFTLVRGSGENQGEKVLFASESETVDGNQVIVNRMMDTVEYQVEKQWKNADGEDIDPPEDAKVYLALYRQVGAGGYEKVNVDENGKEVKIYLNDSDKKRLTEFYTEDGQKITFTQTEAWKGAFTNLPKYNADGSKYDYILVESDSQGVGAQFRPHYEHSLKDDVYTTIVINMPGPSNYINVRKQWVDDSDINHRGDVTVQVWERKGENDFAQVVDGNGNPVGATMESDGLWWDVIGLPASVDKDEVIVLESYVTSAQTSGGVAVDDNLSQTEMEAIYQALKNDGQYDVAKQYDTAEHKYARYYSIEELESEEFYTVTNQRLGVIDLTVTKTWRDGSYAGGTGNLPSDSKRAELKEALDRQGYTLNLKLECIEQPEAVKYLEDEAGDYVDIGDGDTPICGYYDKTNPDLDKGDPVRAIQEIDLTKDTQEFYFWNLPKYDRNGQVVHYTIQEIVLDKDGNEIPWDEAGIPEEYTISKEQTEYEVGELHTHDTQSFEVINSLNGTKDVSYHKEWLDEYRKNSGERPDISLDIYQQIHTEDGQTELKSYYKDYQWSRNEIVDESQDVWDVTIQNLPKYDSYGYEITYYAKEVMNIDKEAFDYQDVYYKVRSTDSANPSPVVIGDEKNGLQDGVADETLVAPLSGSDGANVYLLKEDGIFVNELKEEVLISGKKIWGSIPSGYSNADLPEVNLELWRVGASDEEEKVAWLTIKDWNQQLVDGNYVFGLEYIGENSNRVENGALVVEGQQDAAQIPQYDDQGRIYTYELRESMDLGLKADVDQVYKDPEINGYTINNFYDSEKGSLSVKKIVDETISGSEKYPSVAFNLTRSYVDNAGVRQEDQGYGTQRKILSSEEFDAGEGTAYLTFDDLEIYAPNGAKYLYKITEDTTSGFLVGFEVSSALGDVQVDDKALVKGQTSVDNLEVKVADKDSTTKEEQKASATFQNTPIEKQAPLSFTKQWTDDNNQADVRPKSLTFEIRKRANAQPGQSNAIAEYVYDTVTLTIPSTSWNEKTDEQTLQIGGKNVTVKISTTGDSLGTAGEWTIEMESFDVYAPNGTTWIYKFTEKNVKGPYYAVTGVQSFVYNSEKQAFVVSSGTGKFVNSTTASVKTYKNVRFGAGVTNRNPINRTGYAIELTMELYVAAVQVPDNDISKAYPKAEFYSADWGKASEADYKDLITPYSKESTWKKTVKWANGATLPANSTASAFNVDNLPKIVKDGDGTLYYLQYVMLETGMELKDGANSIYKEIFTPHFKNVDYDFTVSGTQKKGTALGYWIDTENQILGENGWETIDQTLFEPLFGSEEDLDTFCEQGPAKWGYSSMKETEYPFVTIQGNSTYRQSTNYIINLVDETKLSFTKTWENDANNVYGTRPANGSGKWKLDFMIQRKDINDADGDWSNYGSKITISGNNTDAKKSYSATGLLKSGIEKKTENGKTYYKFVEYEYRGRELQPSGTQTVEDGEYFNEAYKVSVEDAGASDSGYSSSVVNTMESVERYAQKNWVANSFKETVNFELQYLKSKTGDTEKWASFGTAAKVALNGTVDWPTSKPTDKEPAYYEYGEWKAKWLNVPKKLAGSVKDSNGDTIYRVVEIAENSYEVTAGTVGTGSSSDPYVLAGDAAQGGSSEQSPVTYRNQDTKLKIMKRIQRPETDAQLNQTELNRDFNFTIEGNSTGSPFNYEKHKNDGSVESGTLKFTSNKATFTLKDGEYILIYGLRKAAYTVTEQALDGYISTYKVYTEDGDAATVKDGTKATVTIPSTRPEGDGIPTVEFINQLAGKITIQKTNENGAALQGVKFQLQYFKETGTTGEEGSYVPVDATVCKDTALVSAKGVGTTGKNGDLTFNKLALGYDYRITEVQTTAGVNKLLKPIDIHLAYESENAPQTGQDAYYTITGKDSSDTKYYYTEVTLKVENNSTFVMPNTAGDGFFWPGMIGLLLAFAGMGFYRFWEERSRRKAGAKGSNV